MMEPCEGCKQPEHCTGNYPDDDKHRPGQLRGCWKEKANSVKTEYAMGRASTKETKGTSARANPAWERGVVGETRPGGGFVPLITKTGAPMGVKEHADNRRVIDKRLREVRKGINLPGATTDSKG